MNALLLLASCLLLGALAARAPGFRTLFPPETPRGLNAWVLNIALPALVLAHIPHLQVSTALALPALAPWGVFLGACLVFPLLGRSFGWSRGAVGALILTCGLGNTAFMGIAMITSLRGVAAVGPAVVADQLGSFLALSTGGVMVAAVYSGGHTSVAEIARKVLTFPPLIALVLGALAREWGGFPPAIDTILHRLGDTLVPLALFSVGFQLRLGDSGYGPLPVVAGLGWKLLLCPLLALISGQLAGVPQDLLTVGVLQAAMAPMISAGLLAEQSGLAPPLARQVVGIGILLSLLTVPIWNGLI